ncbi:hypothetical protein A0128_19370 [Leptospira tipperaryensis]|uniref:Uncharacterized protein n=1 Tax=Leptospira tipperaryensis TaxID=2564040 RepID=A0A1D7V2Z2_9LEPT|nr:hypothetical protein A0128_19370 [Leptospira tipperaryensis]
MAKRRVCFRKKEARTFSFSAQNNFFNNGSKQNHREDLSLLSNLEKENRRNYDSTTVKVRAPHPRWVEEVGWWENLRKFSLSQKFSFVKKNSLILPLSELRQKRKIPLAQEKTSLKK